MRGIEFFREAAKQPPFSRLHPKIGVFFNDYLANEKVIPHQGQYVVNTQFPPYPSPAFDNLAEHFKQIGDKEHRQLYSVTLAITNRCNYHCWHCYNAGREQNDLSLSKLAKVIKRIQELGAVMVTLTGGEPLLRNDLEEIAGLFNSTSCLTLNTTGYGLTLEKAQSLKKNGVFAVGVSLDSDIEEVHDTLRGKKGAFQTALQALKTIAQAGLYPYIITVASHDLIQPARFNHFLKFAKDSGALEIHLLEPCATGKLTGHSEVVLSNEDRQLILQHQKEIAQNDTLPVLSTFLYLESPDAFGCGAGLTHMYIDGSGEVCPCNLVPLSFGNITKTPFDEILNRMNTYFVSPRTGCIGRILSKHIPPGKIPAPIEISREICEKYLPKEHAVPLFFKLQRETQEKVGKVELQTAYDQIHSYYDEFWLKEAAQPIHDLINKVSFQDDKKILEAGCGTGYGTSLLTGKIKDLSQLTAVDLSKGMISEAKKRLALECKEGVRFIHADALEILNSGEQFDIIFSSWVLGYIPLHPFFAAAKKALKKNGQLAFVVHKLNSPQEPLEIFYDLVSKDPSVLLKQVDFDFPEDLNRVEKEMAAVGLSIQHLWDGKICFQYATPEEVMEHLLKSGAGTAFYDAIDPQRRPALEKQFLKIMYQRHHHDSFYQVIHDYLSCITINK